MTPLVLFDLYDTLLRERSFDFGRGLDALHETVFSAVCSREELGRYARTFLPLYEARKDDNAEVCFIRQEYPAFCRRFGICPDWPEDEADYTVLSRVVETEPVAGARDTAERLAARGIPLYVLTNSVFLASSNKRLLAARGIGSCFRDVYSSADFGWRKPARAFFEYGIRRILAENPGAGRTDILFVGNDYETDMEGALAAGLRPVWYREEEPGGRESPPAGVTVIRSLRELPSLLP